MSQEKKPLDPELAEKVTEAAAAAKEEMLSQHVVDALLKVTPDDLIAPNPDAEIIKGGARSSEAWLHAPANLEMLATASKRLTRVAHQDGIMVKKIEKASVRLIKGTTLMVIKAAPKEDLTADSITYHSGSSSAWINCITLLGDADLKVETGYRELYDVAYVPKNSPLWPALVIDLSHPKDRRVEPGFDKKSDDSSDKKTEKTSAKKAEASADKKAEASADKKAEASADKKAEASADKKAEAPADKTAEQTTTKDSAGTGTEQK